MPYNSNFSAKKIKVNKNTGKEKGDAIMRKTNYNDCGTRFLAKGIEVSNDTHITQLNNNDCVVGSSGTGKTTSYVYGNLAKMYGSYIIADTKGNLATKFSPLLKAHGYDVKILDFVNIEKSVGYNPMDSIRRYSDGSYNEQDVITLSQLLSPVKSLRDPYWEDSAKNLLSALIALVMETETPENQDLSAVSRYASDLGFLMHDKQGKPINNAMRRLHNTFVSARERNPQSLAWRKYARFTDLQESEKTWTCIINCLLKAMTIFDGSAFDKMFTNCDKIDLSKPGREKCAYFVNVSDSDRSLDPIANLFYTQVIQALMTEADNNTSSSLDIPARFILDDFATNVYIPDFDKIISVIRSREISVSIILQSITQLDSLYGENNARTIVNNCDHFLYFGGHDFRTAKYISDIANVPLEKVMDMPLDKMYILTRGQKPVYADRLAPDAIDFDVVEPVTTKKEKKKIENIVLDDIPKSLVLVDEEDGSCKFSFAYSLDQGKARYGVIRLPANSVSVNIDNDKKCRIALGAPDKIYNCRISGSWNSISIAAEEVKTMYRRNQRRYIEYMFPLNNHAPVKVGSNMLK